MASNVAAKPHITVLIGIYNASFWIENLTTALQEEINKDTLPYIIDSVIFILDAPIDNSLDLLKQKAAEYDWIRLIEHTENKGQHAALINGIVHSDSDYIVTMDEDMQHPPANILMLYKKLIETQSDICYAKSTIATHSSFMRDSISVLFKNFMSVITRVASIPKFNSFRLIKGDLARRAVENSNADPYLDMLLIRKLKKVSVCEMELLDERNTDGKGKSGFNFWSLVQHAWKMYKSRP